VPDDMKHNISVISNDYVSSIYMFKREEYYLPYEKDSLEFAIDARNLAKSTLATCKGITPAEKPQAVLHISITSTKTSKDVVFNGEESYYAYGEIEYYFFDFGDGENSGWITNSSVRHRYLATGEYNISLKVRAKNGVESNWSELQTIRVSNKKEIDYNEFLYGILAIAVIGTVVAGVITGKHKKHPETQLPESSPTYPQQPPTSLNPANIPEIQMPLTNDNPMNENSPPPPELVDSFAPPPVNSLPKKPEIYMRCPNCGERFPIDIPEWEVATLIECPKCGTRGVIVNGQWIPLKSP